MICIDSSSLILLVKIGIFDKVIENLKERLTITEGVYDECTAKADVWDAKLIKERVAKKRIGKQKLADLKLYEKVKSDFNFGKGEAEAVALCIMNKATLVSDDKKAINACKILGIRFATAGRLLVQLNSKKLISKNEAEAYLENLEKFGRYSKGVLQKIREDIENETAE